MRNITSICVASALALGLGLVGFPNGARAELVFESISSLGAQGFGNAPRLLTLQDNNGSEAVAGTDVGGTPNWTGTGLVQPCCTTTDKYSAPTFSTLAWTTASQVQLGFNASQSNQLVDKSIQVTNVTMDIYSSTGTLIFSASGSHNFTAAQVIQQEGNGNAVFLWGLNATEAAALQLLINAANLVNPAIVPTWRVVLSSSINNSSDGPDSWVGVLGTTVPSVIPLPGAVALFGSGLIGLMMLGRRRARHVAQTAS